MHFLLFACTLTYIDRQQCAASNPLHTSRIGAIDSPVMVPWQSAVICLVQPRASEKQAGVIEGAFVTTTYSWLGFCVSGKIGARFGLV